MDNRKYDYTALLRIILYNISHVIMEGNLLLVCVP